MANQIAIRCNLLGRGTNGDGVPLTPEETNALQAPQSWIANQDYPPIWTYDSFRLRFVPENLCWKIERL